MPRDHFFHAFCFPVSFLWLLLSHFALSFLFFPSSDLIRVVSFLFCFPIWPSSSHIAKYIARNVLHSTIQCLLCVCSELLLVFRFLVQWLRQRSSGSCSSQLQVCKRHPQSPSSPAAHDRVIHKQSPPPIVFHIPLTAGRLAPSNSKLVVLLRYSFQYFLFLFLLNQLNAQQRILHSV